MSNGYASFPSSSFLFHSFPHFWMVLKQILIQPTPSHENTVLQSFLNLPKRQAMHKKQCKFLNSKCKTSVWGFELNLEVYTVSGAGLLSSDFAPLAAPCVFMHCIMEFLCPVLQIQSRSELNEFLYAPKSVFDH